MASEWARMQLAQLTRLLWVTPALLVFGCVGQKTEPTREGKTEGVQITKLPDRLRIEINGKPFTEYWFKDAPPGVISG